jgi:hypothetical protein
MTWWNGIGSWSFAFPQGCKLWRFRMGVSLNSLIRSLQWNLIHIHFMAMHPNSRVIAMPVVHSFSPESEAGKLHRKQPWAPVAWLRRCVTLNWSNQSYVTPLFTLQYSEQYWTNACKPFDNHGTTRHNHETIVDFMGVRTWRHQPWP